MSPKIIFQGNQKRFLIAGKRKLENQHVSFSPVVDRVVDRDLIDFGNFRFSGHTEIIATRSPKKKSCKVQNFSGRLWFMRFFDFLESKFTHASMVNKAEHFSYRLDGEQHATQTYLAFFRFVAKVIGLVSLPTQWLICRLGFKPFPEPARAIVERLVKEGQERAIAMKAAQEKQAKGGGKIIGVAPPPQQSLIS